MARELDVNDLGKLLDFVVNAPADENLINMDCNDGCEKISRLAEQVASGADLSEILPEMEEFMQCFVCCREEFEALVAVIKREMALEGIDAPTRQASLD